MTNEWATRDAKTGLGGSTAGEESRPLSFPGAGVGGGEVGDATAQV